MGFEVDNQTLKDLEIFKTIKNNKSLFDMLNFAVSIGGKNKLYSFLEAPLSDYDKIKERKGAIAFFQFSEEAKTLDIDKNSLDFIEHYLNYGNYPTQAPSRFFAIEKGIAYKIKPNNDYYIIERGIDYFIELMNTLHNFAKTLSEKECPALILKNNEEIFRLFKLDEYVEIAKIGSMEKLGMFQIAQFDYMFRYTHKQEVLFFLNLIYEYDVFRAVAKAARKYNFSYPELNEEYNIYIEGIFHPFIESPVKNDVRLNSENNLLFISGPNMAGKSTFLKSLGIAFYLAHTGFPVPAAKMIFSPFTGLYTTINISDSLNTGFSHFYSEVLRIKHIAKRLKGNNMLVIFDELFRGTNVKDAYDGSLAVISAFTEVQNSYSAISTHIVEVADKLRHISNIQFRYMEITGEDDQPRYSYKLKDGISEDRLGMYILNQEKLIETIKEINN
ncbi:hypothetical protein [Prevotella sp. 10(H)]|uniref:MutS-related protein n=1 Tax=Prevotella sp. 10(H) TaxID=1158294 RepID=UPI0004A747B4|nr:hypothetical protein [Prevotella sp. 10(H)]